MEEIDIEWESANYCAACGDTLPDPVQEFYGYSRSTGMPRYKYIKKCANYDPRQFSIGSLTHDKLTRYESV